MAANKNIPEIRFRGFEGEWKEEKLGKVGDTYSGLTGKTKVDFGHGDGKYITYMNVFSNTIANPKMTEPIEIDKTQNTVQTGDVLFTTSSETPEEVGMSSIWVENDENIYLNSFCFGYRPKTKFDNNYLAYVLRSNTMRKKITFLAQGISRYNISKNRVMEIDLPIPFDDEQTQIGTYFQNLDSLISLQQSKYNKLLTMKKAMLEKMFPKEGAEVPEIRFKGFEGKWEKKKFDTIVNRISSMCKDSKLPRVEYEDIVSCRGVLNKNIYEKVSDKIGIEFYNGDILFGKLRPYLKNWLLATFNGIAVGDFWILRPICSDSSFIFYLIQTNAYVDAANQSSGTKMPRSDWNLVSEKEFKIPKIIEEQTKIGTFFQTLDTLISEQQKQLEKLKNIKKSCLEKMFV